MKKLFSVVMVGLFFILSPSVFACTVFHASNDTYAFGGNNEDYNLEDTYIYFIPGTDTTFGKVIVGYTGSYWIQGGMNERGVFWDGLACPFLEVVNSTHKPYFNGHIFEYILEECDNCAEALAILDLYNMQILERAQILVGDRYGNSFVIEGDVIHMKNRYYQVATNFYLSQYPDPPYPCWRYTTALNMFENNGEENLSVDFCASVCDAVHQEGAYPTQYSTVYDLKKQLVYLYYYHDYERVKVFNLSEELAKGYNEYSIPLIFTQAPEQPVRPSGYTSGVPGEDYSFSSYAVDGYEDELWYQWDWGDGTFSEWLGPYPSGEVVETSHSWDNRGLYRVRVQAKDGFACVSPWSLALSVRMPRGLTGLDLIFQFIENHPLVQMLVKILDNMISLG